MYVCMCVCVCVCVWHTMTSRGVDDIGVSSIIYAPIHDIHIFPRSPTLATIRHAPACMYTRVHAPIGSYTRRCLSTYTCLESLERRAPGRGCKRGRKDAGLCTRERREEGKGGEREEGCVVVYVRCLRWCVRGFAWCLFLPVLCASRQKSKKKKKKKKKRKKKGKKRKEIEIEEKRMMTGAVM